MTKKAFTLIELQIAIVVSAILIIAIGTIASLSTESYNKLTVKANVYNNVAHWVKLTQNKVRESNTILPPDNPGSPWIGERLRVDEGAFGLYEEEGQTNFVYFSDVGDVNTKEIIYSISNSDPVTVDYSIDANEEFVTIDIQGSAADVNLEDLSTIIMRRLS